MASGGIEWTVPWQTRHRLGGGVSVLEADGQPILMRARDTSLYVLTGGEQFSDAWMGEDQGHVPDLALRRLFELEFSLVRGLVEGNVQDELWHGASRPLTIRVNRNPPQAARALDRPGGRSEDR